MILFDEIEKAHHDVFNILLQILDDGRLTDSQGRVVSFKNTIIIMTSNIGSETILDVKGDVEKVREPVLDALKAHFRPEFLNRVDEILIFHALGKDELMKIVDIQLARFAARLADRDIRLEVTPEARGLLCEAGYDPAFGARPLKRAIIRELETPVSRLLIGGELSDGDTLKITAGKDGKPEFACIKNPEAVTD